VVENTGEATLSIPIDVPRGTGGFQPSLALQYSSRRGDGPFGVGWQLALGEVKRADRFGVPRYDSTDRFELSGELLVGPVGTTRYHTATESFARILHEDAGGVNDRWEVTHPNGVTARYGNTQETRIRRNGDTDPADDTGGIYRWLLSEVEDNFGNVVKFEYDRSIDVGTAYPKQITFSYDSQGGAIGVLRYVSFQLEDRPDPQLSFLGSVESYTRKRVSEITSTIGTGESAVPFRKLVLDYASPPQVYTTGRSRIASVQRFGSDCPGACSALPPQTFEYTDATDVIGGTGKQWEPTSWNIPVDLASSDTNDVGGDLGVRFADIDGDGFVDLIQAYEDQNGGSHHNVYRGSTTGFGVKDEFWSQQLSDLEISDSVLHTVRWSGPPALSPIICKVEPQTIASSPVYFSERRAWTKRLLEQGDTWSYRAPIDARIVDLNGDGRADIVVSFRVAVGATNNNNAVCGGSDEDYNPGTHVKHVWINTGTGWSESEPEAVAYRQTLPPFRIMFTTSEKFVSYSYDYYQFADHRICLRSKLPSAAHNTCDSAVYYFDTGVRFADLDGDSRVDLVAQRWNRIFGISPGESYTMVFEQGMWRNTGAGWERNAGYQLPPGVRTVRTPDEAGYVYEGDAGIRFVDLNGDGMDDLIQPAVPTDPDPLLQAFGSGYETSGIWINTGDGWASGGSGWTATSRYGLPSGAELHRLYWRFATTNPPEDPQAPYGGLVENQVRFVDLNDDGLIDLPRTDGTTNAGVADGITNAEGCVNVSAWLQDPSRMPVWYQDPRFDPEFSSHCTETVTSQAVSPQGNALRSPRCFRIGCRSGGPRW
jgi:hypothetical protein